MDEHDAHDVLLLEEAEYHAAGCRGVTKNVISHAAEMTVRIPGEQP